MTAIGYQQTLRGLPRYRGPLRTARVEDLVSRMRAS
jgi:hypothetical protein